MMPLCLRRCSQRATARAFKLTNCHISMYDIDRPSRKIYHTVLYHASSINGVQSTWPMWKLEWRPATLILVAQIVARSPLCRNSFTHLQRIPCS